jgi:hypothetical protein
MNKMTEKQKKNFIELGTTLSKTNLECQRCQAKYLAHGKARSLTVVRRQ